MATSTVLTWPQGGGKKPPDPPDPTPPNDIKLPPSDVSPPTLTNAMTWDADTSTDHSWTAGPDIHLVDQQDNKTSGDLPVAPAVEPFMVSTGALVDTVNALLTETKSQVADYNTFKDHINSVKSWIFCVASAADVGKDGPYAGNQTTTYVNWGTSTAGFWQPQTTTEYYGASPQQVTEVNTYMDNLLMACADTIHMVGQYTLALDGAAQAYANSDYNARYPDPPKIVPLMARGVT